MGPLLVETLRLAAENGNAAPLRARWTDPDVPRLAGAIAAWAAWEGGELWLRTRLAELEVAPPPSLAEALRLAGLRAAQAHLAIEAEGARVHGLLAKAGVPTLLIKGLARRAGAPARLRDTRATSDVDILMRASDAELAWRALHDAGYEPLALLPGAPALRGKMWGESRHHLRPLARAGGASVELHVSTSWELPPDEAWQRLSATARELRWADQTVRIPSPTEMAWHALTHAKLERASAWRLWFWLDAATALALGTIDWQTIVDRLGSPESPEPDAARRWLGVAADLAGVALPPALAPTRPYPWARMLQWRLGAFASRWGRAVRSKLVEEATRAEAGLGLVPLADRGALPVHLRRRLASVAARLVYAVWSAGRP